MDKQLSSTPSGKSCIPQHTPPHAPARSSTEMDHALNVQVGCITLERGLGQGSLSITSLRRSSTWPAQGQPITLARASSPVPSRPWATSSNGSTACQQHNLQRPLQRHPVLSQGWRKGHCREAVWGAVGSPGRS